MILKWSYKISILASLLLICVQTFQAQKIVKATGTAQVRMETNMTKNEAFELAEQQAMIDAIEDNFGTYVEQQTDMTISDGKAAYNIIGTTKVKGDWIETIDKSYSEDIRVENGAHGKENVIYVTCKIKGKIRESIPRADIQYVVLNCPEVACRTTDFIDGEQLYLFFKSPVDGYLSIYVDEGDITYRLLPYVNMAEEYQSGVFVEADKEYIFFDDKINPYQSSVVDEIEMYTLKKLEYNTIYMVFAEKKFVKPVLDKKQDIDNRILPKSLTSKMFKDWLAENRAILESFQDRKVKVSIRPE